MIDPAVPAPPAADASAPDEAIRELARLTLPLMWTLRQDAVRVFDPLGVRPIMALVLELIERGMIHPKDLAEILETNPPAVSALLAELEGRGWLSRATDPADRRRVVLELTGDGLTLLAALRERWLELARERLAGSDPDDLRTLVRVYRRFLAAAHPGHAAPDANGERDDAEGAEA